MQFLTTDDLARELVRLRLVTDEQLAECQAHHPVTSEPATLLKGLEANHVLTNYQATTLRSGDKSPLVLGGSKLMYKNASGSFARVFRGCSIETGEMIGLKVLRQRFVDDPKSVEHFHREAELCKKLQHKNIVPIYDQGTEDDCHYFTMEFVEGGNLRQLINIRGHLEPHELLRCACDMADGLEYALAQGMTHRDFKLSNVLMSSHGVAKLVDFGLAGDDLSSSDENVTAVEYATLEKNTNAPNGDPRSDLFFLGAVLYELSTGTAPYAASSNRDARKQFSRYSSVRPIRQAHPNTPTDIADIIDRLLKINPNERYQSPTEVLADIKPALAEFTQTADSDPESNDPHRQPRLSTILCVEYRVKQQDMMRDYLTRHGFRVLMLSSWERALARLKSSPPDGVILMGEAIEGDTGPVYDEAIQWCKLKSVACILVLPSSEAGQEEQLHLNASARALVQPVRLRDLRSGLIETLQSNLTRE